MKGGRLLVLDLEKLSTEISELRSELRTLQNSQIMLTKCNETHTDLFLDTVRIEFDEDDNHHNHRHDSDPDNDRRHKDNHDNRRNNMELGRGKKRKRVILSERSRSGQNKDDRAESLHSEIDRYQLKEFQIQHRKRKQALELIRTAAGAQVYMSTH
ncbi:MAG: hypothetical protein EZS28_005428 [Streblomastix strix]|uniref:Uncharacterized protein n=1 Tax=Streblomastix strix TaxID=222440 RepID=A0A5J4WVK3_9EUKA|nr:MAG: hypothetical protein EZS28_005428 [Streblomastix strix]